jgi:tRNA threonylcarbamoyladenosine biosynthesis protein TsaB
MVLLAVDTTSATGSLSVADVEHSRILATRTWQKKSSHSDVITLELGRALKSANLSLEQLTHFSVDVGPGSFTGIRVGLNMVRSLAYSMKRPVRIFSSLEVLAYQEIALDQSAVIAIPALQEFFYAGVYRRTKAGIEVISPAESLDQTGISALSTKTNVEKIIHSSQTPSSESIADLIFLSRTSVNWGKSNFLSWEHTLPLYVRRSEAEEKLRKGLLKPLG